MLFSTLCLLTFPTSPALFDHRNGLSVGCLPPEEVECIPFKGEHMVRLAFVRAFLSRQQDGTDLSFTPPLSPAVSARRPSPPLHSLSSARASPAYTPSLSRHTSPMDVRARPPSMCQPVLPQCDNRPYRPPRRSHPPLIWMRPPPSPALPRPCPAFSPGPFRPPLPPLPLLPVSL